MTVLVIWALLAGQPVMAQHNFGDPQACERVRELVVHQIKNEGAQKIVAICSQEPAL